MVNDLPTSIQFSSYILRYARNENITPNLTKIQKWTYICYGLHLAVSQGKDFLFDEKPYCWPHGPVFPQVFYAQKDHHDFFIQEYKTFNFEPYIPLVKFVFIEWGTWSAAALSKWSHNENGAWRKASCKDPHAPHRIALDPVDIYQDFRGYVQNE